MFGLTRNQLIGLVAAIALTGGIVTLGLSNDEDEVAASDDANEAKGKKGRKGKKRRAKNRRSKGDGPGLCKRLECTPAQAEIINPLVKQYRKDARADRKAQRQGWAELARLYRDETLDEEALDAAFDQVGEAEANLQSRARTTLAEVHAVLEPTQRELLTRSVAAKGPLELLEPSSSPRKGAGKGKGKRRNERAAARRGNRRDGGRALARDADPTRFDPGSVPTDDPTEPADPQPSAASAPGSASPDPV